MAKHPNNSTIHIN